MGVILYEMLTGKLPFGISLTSGIGTVFRLIQDNEVTYPENISIPLSLKKIISKALAKNPSERYQSTSDMLKDLRSVRQKGPTPEKEITQDVDESFDLTILCRNCGHSNPLANQECERCGKKLF